MAAGLVILGVAIFWTWGIASIGLVVGGIFLIFFAGPPLTSSPYLAGGLFLFFVGLITTGMMFWMIAPMLGIDPPIPLRAKNIIPAARMKKTARAGTLRDLPDGLPKEIRLHSVRVTLIRQGDEVYALNGLCPHARLPLAGLPGTPVKPYAIQEGCVMCPFHGARFDITNGHVVRQPFSSQFNNDHPFLGRFQEKLLFWNKGAEDIQTFPVAIENGEIIVSLPR